MAARLYTEADIAQALGVTPQAVNKRAVNGRKNRKGRVVELPWPIHSRRREKNGNETKLYAFETLPAGVRSALDTWEQCKRIDEKSAEVAADLAALDAAARAGQLAAKHYLTEEQRAKDDIKMGRDNAGLELLKRFPTITDAVKARALGRLEIVQKYKAFAKSAGRRPGTKALNEFAQNYSSNGAGCLETTRTAVKKISGRNLRRLVDGFKIEGLAALVDSKDGSALAGHGKIEDQAELKAFVVALLVEHPRIKDKQIDDAISARFGERLAPVTWTLKQAHPHSLVARPEISAIRRFRERWQAENAGVRTALMAPDKWKNEQMLAFGDASGDVTHPNYRWEVDSTPGDVLLLDDESATGVARYSVLGVLDVFTRRLKLLVSKTSKSIAIGALIRRAIMDWGVPERRKADNGKDYQAQYLNIFFDAIGAEREDCAPFSGWQKAHMERSFRTFNHGMLELMPGFIGHNVAERKEIEARASFAQRLFQKDGVLEVRVTPADFQQFCDDWCENVYHHAPHEGLEGKSPFAVISAWKAPIRRIDDERALDMLLAPLTGSNGGYFSLQKKGIRIQKHWYIAPELGARTVGERLQVRSDVADIGRKFIFDADGQFICLAVCPELTGISQAEIANKAKAIQRETIKEQKAALKRIARKADVEDIAREIMRDKAQAAGKLSMFPKASASHSTDALREAGRAAASASGQPAVSGGDLVIGGQVISATEIAAPRAEVIAMPKPRSRSDQTPAENYAEWLAVGERIARGEEVSAQDRRFRESWPESSRGKAYFAMLAEAKKTAAA